MSSLQALPPTRQPNHDMFTCSTCCQRHDVYLAAVAHRLTVAVGRQREITTHKVCGDFTLQRVINMFGDRTSVYSCAAHERPVSSRSCAMCLTGSPLSCGHAFARPNFQLLARALIAAWPTWIILSRQQFLIA